MPFHLDPPPGFSGLRDDLPVTRYRRNLPHWRQDGATYFTTFRLNDSLPGESLAELKQIRADWERRNPPPRTMEQQTELATILGRRSEYWLDQGFGSCFFKETRHRVTLENALRFFDVRREPSDREQASSRYELGAYVVMPNHAHALVRPLIPDRFPLEKIEQSWKRFVSREINRARGASGAIWFEESYDRIVRDAEHLYRCLQYIGRNAEKAGLAEGESSRWVRPEWEDGGWGFRER
jgi:hypothetical protein